MSRGHPTWSSPGGSQWPRSPTSDELAAVPGGLRGVVALGDRVFAIVWDGELQASPGDGAGPPGSRQ